MIFTTGYPSDSSESKSPKSGVDCALRGRVEEGARNGFFCPGEYRRVGNVGDAVRDMMEVNLQLKVGTV